jgi:multidrug efflux pump subunit AcrA (membrane-fusion protein)
VARLNKEADTVTRELEVDVKFATLPEPLVIGEEAEVDIDTGRQTAPAIPLSVILNKNGNQGVLVADKGLVRFQKITLGLHDGKQTAVLTGLKEGKLVIAHPMGLAPGKKIRPELQPPAAQRD